MEDWSYHIVQPVVPLKGERRQWQTVLYDLASRQGYKEKYLQTINNSLNLKGEYAFRADDEFTAEILVDRVARQLFGNEHGWEWFRDNGFLRWPKKVEEAYWRDFIDARVPIYLEYLVEIGEKIKVINDETGLDFDISQYTPLISWTPTSVQQVDDSRYDLYCFSYRDILHTGSSTMEQPWIDEASLMNPYTYTITVNHETAVKKGLEEGDIIEIETNRGRKTVGRLKLMEGQHPQVVGIAANSGHWAKGLPIAKGKGSNFDILLELDQKHLDPICTTIETSVRVNVHKLGSRKND
jgi:anaerobic selenocysteine-containing dehydrogenase